MAFIPNNKMYCKKIKEDKISENICVDCGEVNGGGKFRCQLCGGKTHCTDYDREEENSKLIDNGEGEKDE